MKGAIIPEHLRIRFEDNSASAMKRVLRGFSVDSEAERIPEALDEDGVVVIRGIIPKAKISNALVSFCKFYDETRNIRAISRWNSADYNSDSPTPSEVLCLAECEEIVSVVKNILGGDVGLYGRKLLVKDARSPGSVHLHQDSCYQHGLPKVIAFMPLTECSPENGMIHYLPGTHSFGYLGDCGEINRNLLEDNWPDVQPNICPGDIVLMNSHLWHYSDAILRKSVRALLTASYNRAQCLTSIKILTGEQTATINCFNNGSGLFVRSRVSRLHELQSQADNPDSL